jgi:hypothetical protein
MLRYANIQQLVLFQLRDGNSGQMKVDQTCSQLEATCASFENVCPPPAYFHSCLTQMKASDRLVKQQQDITSTIGEMTRLSLTNAGLQRAFAMCMPVSRING